MYIMNTTTLLLLKMVSSLLGELDSDTKQDLAHACAMDIEDNHGAEYSTNNELESMVKTCEVRFALDYMGKVTNGEFVLSSFEEYTGHFLNSAKY